MKIVLSQDEVANLSGGGTQLEELAKAISGCKLGDRGARPALDSLFAPLIALLVAKRAGDPADAKLHNELRERGRAGLYRAAKRFPAREPVRRFHLFALDYIEAEMDHPARGLMKLFR